MLIDIEKAASILSRKFYSQDMDELLKMKIEYGISILLGIVITSFVAVSFSIIFNVAEYMILLMVTSLILRKAEGGEHCTSYDRCMIFTIVLFLTLSIIAKQLYLHLDHEIIVYTSLITFILYAIGLKKWKFLISVMLIAMISLSRLQNMNSWSVIFLCASIALILQSFMKTEIGCMFVLKSDLVLMNMEQWLNHKEQ